MISIDKNITLAEFEDAYLRISHPESEILNFPENLSLKNSFGIPASAVQFVATWTRLIKNGLLKIHTDSDAEVIDSYLSTSYGLVAAYLAAQISIGENAPQDKNSILSRMAKNVVAMQSSQFAETAEDSVLLACFSGARNEYLLPLYSRASPDGLRDTSDFHGLARSLIRVCFPSEGLMFRPDAERTVGSIIRELVENTNDHARHDLQAKPYDWRHPSVRGVLARRISFDKPAQDFQAMYGDPHLLAFFMRSNLRRNDPPVRIGKTPQPQEFFELTVFDTGPGLAAHWCAHQGKSLALERMSINEEFELVKSAFNLGSSSKEVSGAGVGLHSVLKGLGRLHAFLKLRTGRLCLYQDFGLNRSDGETKFEPKHNFKDRETLFNAAGTFYSILVPLEGLIER